MAEELRYLQREIWKVRQYLSRLEYKVMKTQRKLLWENEEQRLKCLEAELKRKNPKVAIDRELLRLVGTEPYNPPSKDKEITRQIVAERYG